MTTASEKFDPAAWTAWAERLGYQIYLGIVSATVASA
jgi:hypothetical protein